MKNTTRSTPLAIPSSFSEGEKRLLKRIHKKFRMTITRFERTPLEFDMVIEGTAEDGTRFKGFLPLMAIRTLTNWCGMEIAAMTDYPQMTMEGDWSGVRDSDRGTIWRIFRTAVLKQ